MQAWRGSTGSRGGRPCARGCTASPPTSASTCSRPPTPGPPDGPGPGLHRGLRSSPTRRRAGLAAAHRRQAGCCPPTAIRPSSAAARESIRLAFVAALQHLPPRQRAVLILREVLRWKADRGRRAARVERAVVNNALQRARATLARAADPAKVPVQRGPARELLARYVDAFERYDITSLVALLHEDATFCMPPYANGCRGRPRSAVGSPGRASVAAARCWWPPRPTGAPPSAATGARRPTATHAFARSRSSRSQVGGSPLGTTSSARRPSRPSVSRPAWSER